MPDPNAPRISDDPIRCAFDRRAALMPWRHRQPVPEADIAPTYEQAVQHFKQAGWRQLSNSHWAATPSERNRYNRLIKQGAPTLAYGSGAGGSLGRYSYANTATLADAVAVHLDQAALLHLLGLPSADKI